MGHKYDNKPCPTCGKELHYKWFSKWSEVSYWCGGQSQHRWRESELDAIDSLPPLRLSFQRLGYPYDSLLGPFRLPDPLPPPELLNPKRRRAPYYDGDCCGHY